MPPEGCDEYAAALQEKIGGDIYRISPPGGGYVFPEGAYALGPREPWVHHTVVVKDGRVFDAYVSAEGMPIEEWKLQWGELASEIDFGF